MSRRTVPTIGPSRTQLKRRELRGKIASLMGAKEKWITDVPGLSLVHRTKGSSMGCGLYEPSIAVVAQGRKEVTLGKRKFIYDESRYLLTTIDLPVVSRPIGISERQPLLAISLSLDLNVVRELLTQSDLPTHSPQSDGLAMATGEVSADLLDACCRLVDLVDSPADIPVLGGLIQREIVYRILRAPEGGRLRAIATRAAQSQKIAKAISWIKSNFAARVPVEALARIAGLGVSTFHKQFHALTAMSPLQYQKRLRLQAARSRMLLDGLEVASAAFEVGYESASQFNREYRRLFGHPPGANIRALRSEAMRLNEATRGGM